MQATTTQIRDVRMPQRKGGHREVPRTASCASAKQRGKDFPVASKSWSVKDAVPSRDDEKGRGEGRENATKCK